MTELQLMAVIENTPLNIKK